ELPSILKLLRLRIHYPMFNERPTASYNTAPCFDLSGPFSDFSRSFNSVQFADEDLDCGKECIDTAECFKVNRCLHLTMSKMRKLGK
ncbi:unnamed protein product, partial [Oikopleura dioica]